MLKCYLIIFIYINILITITSTLPSITSSSISSSSSSSSSSLANNDKIKLNNNNFNEDKNEFSGITDKAYVTILSSEDFLLAAKIVSFQLKTLNDRIPFVIFCTEDVSDNTMEILKKYGATTRRITKLDTPFLIDHPEKKFQYTKMRLWCHTEYKTLIHLDLDTITLEDTSELFQCKDFCASLRHSDRFNSGVFVFRPNKEICDDLMNSSHYLDSYDGGDQGFMNSYFSDLKYSSMFNPDDLSNLQAGKNGSTKYKSLRLSSIYNYDVGMYYLSGRMLVKPKIIHYTLGPIKPWIWWSYPIFDLNWKWLDIRLKMEDKYGSDDYVGIMIVKEVVLIIICSFLYIIFKDSTKNTNKEIVGICGYERSLTGIMMLFISFIISFSMIPEHMWPTHAWVFFTMNMAIILVTLLLLYSNIRLKFDINFSTVLHAAIAIIGPILLFWNILYCIDKPGKRYITGILSIATIILGVNEVIKLVLFNQQCRQFRYIRINKA